MKPPDTEPSELFAKLIEMPRPSEIIDFPRNDEQGKPVGRVRIQILTSLEHDRARLSAHASLKKDGFEAPDMSAPAVREVLGDLTAKELIAMACLTERNYGEEDKPIYGRTFRNAKDVNALGADEILILFNSYLLVQNKYGPFERNLSKDDVDLWIQRLQEGAAEFPLLKLPLPQLVLLVLSLGERLFTLYRIMASQLSSLPPTLAALLPDSFTDTTSVGSQPDAADQDGSERSDRPLTPISVESATEMARKMRDARES